MVLVFLPWFIMKNVSSDKRLSPLRYDHMSGELHRQHPDLWSEQGPLKLKTEDLGIISKLKWKLIMAWTSEASRRSQHQFLSQRKLGAIGRAQETLVRKWTSEIQLKPRNTADDTNSSLTAGAPRTARPTRAWGSESNVLSELPEPTLADIRIRGSVDPRGPLDPRVPWYPPQPEP